MTHIYLPKDVIAACLILEAGGEGYSGMQAVMNVIQNRAGEDPQKYYAIVTCPYQFSSLNGATGIFFKDYSPLVSKAKKSPCWQTAAKIVEKAYSKKLSDLTQGATYYYSLKANKKPAWSVTMIETTTLKNHRFLRTGQKWSPIGKLVAPCNAH